MQKKSFIIIGAGISGLSLAWYLRKKFPDGGITLVDANEKVGGAIETIHGEFFFERGPRTFPRSKAEPFFQLVQEVGLEGDIIYAPRLPRFVYLENKLHPLPTSLWQIITSRLTKGLCGALFRDCMAASSTKEDESVYDFFVRHFGEKWTYQIVDPFFTGIYAGDIRQLSISATMPKIKQWDKQHGSLIKASWKEKKSKQLNTLFTLRSGLENLCQILLKESEARFIPGFAASTIMRQKEGIVVKSDQESLVADHVFSTVILPGKLSSIQRKSLSVVNLGYRKKLSIPKGFGYLIPSGEKEEVRGVIFDSEVFAEQNQSKEETRLTVIMDLKENAEEVAVRALRKHLGIETRPDCVYVKEYPHAIVQPQIFHKEKMQAMLPRWEGVTWLGTHLHGVSLSDCVLAAKNTVEIL